MTIFEGNGQLVNKTNKSRFQLATMFYFPNSQTLSYRETSDFTNQNTTILKITTPNHLYYTNFGIIKRISSHKILHNSC